MSRKKLPAGEYHNDRARGRSSYLDSQYEEEINRLRAEGAKKDELLERCRVALNDWINDWAPEMCDPERVQETEERLSEKGTLMYISEILQAIRVSKGQSDE